jgi:hypothetical protein
MQEIVMVAALLVGVRGQPLVISKTYIAWSVPRSASF